LYRFFSINQGNAKKTDIFGCRKFWRGLDRTFCPCYDWFPRSSSKQMKDR
jgi:hypothetical protein